MKTTLLALGQARGGVETLGVYALESHLRNEHPEEDLLVHSDQFPSLSTDELDERLSKSDLIGLSTQLDSLDRTNEVLAQINGIKAATKERVLVVLGGIYGTFSPELILENNPELICVSGEGEEALSDILELWRNSDLDGEEFRRLLLDGNVRNLVMFMDGKIIRTKKVLSDLSALALPDRNHVKDVIAAGGLTNIEASRGCQWGRCKFCCIAEKYDGINWRAFPLERVVDDLKALSAEGVKKPYFTDEDFFGADPQRIKKLATMILEAKKEGTIAEDMKFFISVRVRSLVSKKEEDKIEIREILLLMKEAGFDDIFLGIESGAKEQLRRYCKGVTVEENLQAIRLVEELGLSVDIGFIMFDPLMNVDDILENITFIREADITFNDSRFIKKLRLIHATPIMRNYADEGMITSSDLNLNEQQYSYDFIDDRVQEIYNFMRAWEQETEDFVYDLQNASRGEQISTEKRERVKTVLAAIRALHLNLLEALANNIETNISVFNKRRFALITEGQQLLASS